MRDTSWMGRHAFSTMLLLTAVCASVQSGAYTLELRCDGDGRLIEHRFQVTTNADAATHQRQLSLAARPREMCRDFKSCFGELSDIARLARDTSDVVQKYAADYEAHQRTTRAPAQIAYHQEVGRLQELLGDCVNYRGLHLADEKRGSVTLFYPFNGPLSGKVSRNYDKVPLEQLVKQAVQMGVDPYVVLAIKLLEDPPLKHEAPRVLHADDGSGNSDDVTLPSAEEYQNNYGLLPVDSIAAREILGCGMMRRESLKTPVRPEQVAGYEAIYKRQNDTNIQIARLSHEVSRTYDNLFEEIDFDRRQVTSTQLALEGIDATPSQDREARRIRLIAKLGEWRAKLDAVTSEQKKLEQRPEYARYVALKAKSDAVDKELDAYQNKVTAGLPEADRAAAICVLKGRQQCYGLPARQKLVPTLILTDAPANAPSQKICTGGDPIGAGDGLTFATGTTEGCCVNVKTSGEAQKPKAQGQLLTALAIAYARDRVLRDAKPGAKLSWVLQGYNGRGCFGCTEGHGYYDKGCLGNIDMNTRPVYGAKAADLIVNTLMRNPEIVAMVDSAAENHGARPPSVFCQTRGPGLHEISDREFLDEQTRYLLKSEPARARLCAPLFKNIYRSTAAGT